VSLNHSWYLHPDIEWIKGLIQLDIGLVADA
jgi:hypothetical protein